MANVLNAMWHSLGGQRLDATWLNLGGHYLNAMWHLLSENGVWPIKKSFDYYIDESKWLVKSTSQKCQFKLGQKVHGPVTMDRFKTTCLKWLRGFFYAYPKWIFFYQNF